MIEGAPPGPGLVRRPRIKPSGGLGSRQSTARSAPRAAYTRVIGPT